MKVVGIATIPSRINTLEQVLDSLHDQVDIIELALNDFLEIPSFIGQFPRVRPILSTNEKGDANKYLQVGNYQNDYYFSCDDDILYPKNYIETFAEAIDTHNALITIHGSSIPSKKIESYYKQRIRNSYYWKDCKEVEVHIPGTGVSGFHTSFLKLHYENSFPVKNMADVFVGIQCLDQGIKCISLEHSKDWIDGGLHDDEGRTIFNTYKGDDPVQAGYINTRKWI